MRPRLVGGRWGLALVAFLAALLPSLEALAQEAPAAEGWVPFAGSWLATGTRRTLPTGGDRPAAIVHLSGSVLLTTGEGLSGGFLAEAIGFDDGERLSVGRSLFTDNEGHRIFAELEGDRVAAGRRLRGTITGGTGRYAGLSGEFTVEWQYVVETEEGTIEARGVRFEGRCRRGGAAAPGPRAGGAPP